MSARKLFVNPLKLLMFGLVFSAALNSYSQISISSPKHVCIGDLIYFKLNNPNNLSISKTEWKFGNGFSSKSKEPFHLYKNTGNFKVSLKTTLTNGTVYSDSVFIDVLELPKALLVKDANSDSCILTNLVKFFNQSTPANAGQPLTKNLMVWGDGDFDNSSPSFNQVHQHHYQMNDRYKVKLEVTDIKGCKSTNIQYIDIIDGGRAIIDSTVTYPSCGNAKVCFSNKSLSNSQNTTVYKWEFDNNAPIQLNYSYVQCYNTSVSKTFKAILTASNPNNTCQHKDTLVIPIVIEPFVNQLEILNNPVCFGDNGLIKISNTLAGATYKWFFENKPLKDNKQDLFLKTKTEKDTIYPGSYNITCVVEKNGCIFTYSTTLVVQGPVADMLIVNKKQCGVDKKVYMIDQSRFISRSNAEYTWSLVDPEGNNCTTDRANNQNKNSNCNFSKDWFHKHKYTVARPFNKIEFTVKDKTTGCTDTKVDYARHDFCKLLVQGQLGFFEICQGDKFLDHKKYNVVNPPAKFSLDTGKTYLGYPSVVDKPYLGWYGVSMIFFNEEPYEANDIGDDSFELKQVLPFYDTLFAPDALLVKFRKSVGNTVEIEPGCSPFHVSLNLIDTVFKAGEYDIVNWGDDHIDTFHYLSDTIVSKHKHLYHKSGFDGKIYLFRQSIEGCETYDTIRLKFGKELKIEKSGNPCMNSEMCFNAKVINFNSLDIYKQFKSIDWYLDSVNVLDSNIQFCDTFTQSGYHSLKTIYKDSLDCIDTIYTPIYIRDLKAGIFKDSRISFCSELKQLFDSSYYVNGQQMGDFIQFYKWDFGSNLFSTTEKDPFKSFDLEDSIVYAKHAIEDNNGCKDTIAFEIKVIGSLPRFEFNDTVGCAPYKVTFKNKSKKCSSYIWEFGDEDNNTFENNDEGDVVFTYDKPGKFYPKLIGIDTFFNENTGSVYYCNEVFDPNSFVNVLKTIKSTLEKDDTICLGQTVFFKSTSDDALFNNWDFGDGYKAKLPITNNAVPYVYQTEGVFKVKAVPVFTFPDGVKCLDSNTVTITVIGVNADFEIDPKSDEPIFYFNSLSSPDNAKLFWNFGQPSSGSDNFSNDKNTMHNYGLERSTFKVCLTAVNGKCRDSVCKPVTSNYEEYVKLFNVFTPGNINDKNDEFDAIVKGEKDYRMIIYDRWGIEVYNSEKDGEIGDGYNWNGRLHNTGDELASGTYYYLLEFKYKRIPDKKQSFSGVITLIR